MPDCARRLDIRHVISIKRLTWCPLVLHLLHCKQYIYMIILIVLPFSGNFEVASEVKLTCSRFLLPPKLDLRAVVSTLL
jgi:hypothetical protein